MKEFPLGIFDHSSLYYTGILFDIKKLQM